MVLRGMLLSLFSDLVARRGNAAAAAAAAAHLASYISRTSNHVGMRQAMLGVPVINLSADVHTR